MNALAININAIYATVILSAVLVPLGSLLKREHWNNAIKFGVAAVASLLLAAGQVALVYKSFTWGAFAVHLGMAVTTAQTIFHVYFKNSGFDNYLESIGSSEPALEAAVNKVSPSAGKAVESVEASVTGAPTVIADPLPLPTGAVAASTTVDATSVVTPPA